MACSNHEVGRRSPRHRWWLQQKRAGSCNCGSGYWSVVLGIPAVVGSAYHATLEFLLMPTSIHRIDTLYQTDISLGWYCLDTLDLLRRAIYDPLKAFGNALLPLPTLRLTSSHFLRLRRNFSRINRPQGRRAEPESSTSTDKAEGSYGGCFSGRHEVVFGCRTESLLSWNTVFQVRFRSDPLLDALQRVRTQERSSMANFT